MPDVFEPMNYSGFIRVTVKLIACGSFKVTEELVRKRSEHNELIISTLEEISLHQQDIEKYLALHALFEKGF